MTLFRTVSTPWGRFRSAPISLDTFRYHCRVDYRHFAREGYTPQQVIAIYSGLAGGRFLGYAVRCKSSYVGISTNRGADRYTRLSHRRLADIIAWLQTGREV